MPSSGTVRARRTGTHPTDKSQSVIRVGALTPIEFPLPTATDAATVSEVTPGLESLSSKRVKGEFAFRIRTHQAMTNVAQCVHAAIGAAQYADKPSLSEVISSTSDIVRTLSARRSKCLRCG